MNGTISLHSLASTLHFIGMRCHDNAKSAFILSLNVELKQFNPFWIACYVYVHCTNINIYCECAEFWENDLWYDEFMSTYNVIALIIRAYIYIQLWSLCVRLEFTNVPADEYPSKVAFLQLQEQQQQPLSSAIFQKGNEQQTCIETHTPVGILARGHFTFVKMLQAMLTSDFPGNICTK